MTAPLGRRQHCGSCRYFWPALTSISGFANRHDDGECRIMPPKVNDGPDHSYADGLGWGWRIWPAVSPDDWCGAWTDREESP